MSKGKYPQIEEKSSFRFNCLTLSCQAKKKMILQQVLFRTSFLVCFFFFFFFCLFSCYSHQSISDYSWKVCLQDEPTCMRIEPAHGMTVPAQGASS